MNIYDEKDPVLDLDVTVTVKVRELVKLHQLLSRLYSDEEGLRETLGPLLEKLHDRIAAAAEAGEAGSWQPWGMAEALAAKASSRQEKHLKRIQKALLKDSHLRLTYLLPGTAARLSMTAAPRALWETASGWMLSGYSYQDGEDHTWPVNQLLKVKRKSPSGKRHRGVSLGGFAPFGEPASPEPDEPEDDAMLAAGLTVEPVEGPGTGHAALSPEHGSEQPLHGPAGHHPHYSLPGRNPHRPGLPNRLERLLIRSEKLKK